MNKRSEMRSRGVRQVSRFEIVSTVESALRQQLRVDECFVLRNRSRQNK